MLSQETIPVPIEDAACEPSSEAARAVRRTDVVIIGAGLAGNVAASTLARAGIDVVIIDAAAVVPPSLRAEKLGTPILALFDRLGLDKVALVGWSERDLSRRNAAAMSFFRPLGKVAASATNTSPLGAT